MNIYFRKDWKNKNVIPYITNKCQFKKIIAWSFWKWFFITSGER